MTSSILGIVADDLTGAMDTSVVFASRGMRSITTLGADISLDFIMVDVICCNTQSRFLTEAEAIKSVKLATRRLQELGYTRLYKKIDSTLRGHVGAEINAMMQEAGATVAFVCPAFPAMGRTVRNGIAYVGERPLRETQEGGEAAGTSSSSVTEFLAKQTGVKTGLIDISYYRNESSIESRITRLIANGCRIIVFDATSEKHLARIVEATKRWRNQSILVGSAGLASAIASTLEEGGYESSVAPVPKVSSHPAILVSGSLSRVTQTQLEALRGVSGLEHIPIGASQILGSKAAMQSEVGKIIEKAQSALKDGKDAVLFWGDPDTLESAIIASEDSRWLVGRIDSAINAMMTAILARSNISGLILVGGETAYAVLNALEAEAIELGHEVLSGIPFGTIVGGLANGKFVITKAGGFGSETTLVNVINSARRLRKL